MALARRAHAMAARSAARIGTVLAQFISGIYASPAASEIGRGSAALGLCFAVLAVLLL